jgi:uncharacterized membrane protein YhhN
MLNFSIVLLAAGLLAGLLYCEKKELFEPKLAVKSVLSSLFIFTAVVQSHPIFPFYRLLLIAMIFCLGGDVFLALRGEKMFLYGLVSFLLGHLFYAGAFFHTAGLNRWTFIGLAISLSAGGGVFLWLRSHLGAMKIPVILYILVISGMVAGAGSLMAVDELKLSGRWLAFIGALNFYLSDVFVARQRFLKTGFVNRLIGLPLYYSGQFLLAFSIGLLRPVSM